MGAGGARVKEAVLTIAAFILACALVFAVLRANNVTSVEGLLTTLRQGSGQVENAVKTGDYGKYVCNVLADPDCVFSKDARAKIGDWNRDGAINDLDVTAYQKAKDLLKDTGESTEKKGTGDKDSGQVLTGDAQQALNVLDRIVEGEDDGSDYSRSEYAHWATISGKCDARETVLANAGFNSDPKTCKALTGGSYTDPYTGKTFNDPSKLDIDHIIPLGYVNQHGGKAWSKEKKKQYANDTSNVLIAVDASANRAKGDKGPAGWMPSNKSYQCDYAKAWVTIADKYGISLNGRDKDKLRTTLKTCTVG